MSTIAGAALDPKGVLYLSDLANGRVIRIDTRSSRWTAIGRKGQGPGEFTTPQSIALTSQATIVVHDPAQSRIVVMSPSGKVIQTSQLSEQITYVKGMLADSGIIYISGTSASGPGASFTIHQYRTNGEHLLSFGKPNPRFPSTFERMLGDAGPIAWGPRRASIWLSQGGPDLQLYEFSRSGAVLRSIKLAQPLLPSWEKRMKVASRDGQVSVSAAPLLGTIALIPISDTLLLNVAALDEAGTFRYDLFTVTTGGWVSSWTEKRSREQGIIGFSDGRSTLYAIDPVTNVSIVAYPTTIVSP